MNFLTRLLFSAIAVVIGAYILPGVQVDGFWNALIVALVLAILNAIIRPVLIILTIPITIVTLGLFLLVINSIIILMADGLVGGFYVDGFWWALVLSLILTILNSFFADLKKEER